MPKNQEDTGEHNGGSSAGSRDRHQVSFHRSQSDHIAGMCSSSANDFLTNSPLLHRTTAPKADRRGSAVMGSSSDPRQSFRRMTSETDPLIASPRRRSMRYDASHTMDRLRSTFIADYPQDTLNVPALSTISSSSIDSSLEFQQPKLSRKSHRQPSNHLDQTAKEGQKDNWKKSIQNGLGQVPAVVLIGMFHLMIGIPFGVSYFPVGWRSDMDVDTNTTSVSTGESDDFVHGPFPVPGKEALGIRMFLYSTIIAQVVFTWKSEFVNPIGLEMVENVPFYHELAAIAIKHCGYGVESLVNLLFMFGLASVLVGAVFYGLGKYELGRVVYFFPMHVLVGCIGGIGLYIARTGLEVTMDVAFNVENIIEHWDLLRITFLFEILLRVLERVTLDAEGKPRYTLLSPIYFCMITPLFYLGLLLFQVPIQAARDGGYFFPSIETASAGSTTDGETSTDFWNDMLADDHMFDLWNILDVRVVSWSAMVEAIPTLVVTLFSLIHVPINIPAFGISTGVDVDMNNELIAHGYSNFLSGIFGCGLQNYLAYTQSVVYDRSGGRGKRSGIAVAIVTAALFVVGPTITSFIPRAMAGALLLHVGIDLFLEGVYDSYKKFDNLEYVGIWLIVIVMSLKGMEAAMIAGVIAALSTYAMQSITYLNPIRGSMSAVTLRSSHRNRNYRATNVLDDPVNGRSRILVIQLQGHLFFGNLAQLNEGINNLLAEATDSNNPGVPHRQYSDSHRRRIVIIDFSLVVGIDSSAAQGLIKLKNAMQKVHGADVCIFVTGSEQGFPCEFDLSSELTSTPQKKRCVHRQSKKKTSGLQGEDSNTQDGGLDAITEASSLLYASTGTLDRLMDDEQQPLMDFSGSFVLESLDLGLIFAENVLIAWEDPTLLDDYDPRSGVADHFNAKWKEKPQSPSGLITDAMLDSSQSVHQFSGKEEELDAALGCIMNICPDRTIEKYDMKRLLSHFVREFYVKDEFVWKQGDAGDSTKLILSGMLIAILENEAGTSEVVFNGNFIGELGLVQRVPRLSSVQCVSEEGVIMYSLGRESYENLVKTEPRLARVIDLICIQYLANRVQHVSNRMIETRCLPI